MRLTELYRLSLEELRAADCNIVAASGFESRARAILDVLPESCGHGYALGFDTFKSEKERIANDAAFESAGFELVPAVGSSYEAVEMLTNQLIQSSLEEGRILVVDISSMTRVWYGAMIRAARLHKAEGDLDIVFAYFPPREFRPLREQTPNEVVGPVVGFASIGPPDLPLALVVGTGFDSERVLGLRELLDPKFSLFGVPGVTVRGLNEIDEIDPVYPIQLGADAAVEYPLQDPVATFRLFESICTGLRERHRVVLASLGPKIFGLICFLLAIEEPSLSVWRVSSGGRRSARNVQALKSALVLCGTRWTSNDQ